MRKIIRGLYALGYNTFLETSEQFGEAVIYWVLNIQLESMTPEQAFIYGELLDALDQGGIDEKIGALRKIVKFPGPNTLFEVINVIEGDPSLAIRILACQTLQKLITATWRRDNLLEIGVLVFAAEGLLSAVKQNDFPTLRKEAQKAADCIREAGMSTSLYCRHRRQYRHNR